MTDNVGAIRSVHDNARCPTDFAAGRDRDVDQVLRPIDQADDLRCGFVAQDGAIAGFEDGRPQHAIAADRAVVRDDDGPEDALPPTTQPRFHGLVGQATRQQLPSGDGSTLELAYLVQHTVETREPNGSFAVPVDNPVTLTMITEPFPYSNTENVP